MNYTVSAVDPEFSTYTSPYGDMRQYRVRFEGSETVVNISQKTETPAPKVGDVLEGTIDMSAKYGPKFKKEFVPKQQSFGGNKPLPKPQTIDTSAMYTAYAKDIVVALIGSLTEPSSEKFKTEYETALAFVKKGARVLEPDKEESHEQAGF